MNTFEQLGLDPVLLKSLKQINYTTPTPIQAQAIPLALEGKDIMGSAQTGTGKTAAFAIPLVETLLRNPSAEALVLTPTRELGKQVMDVLHQLLGRKSKIKTAFLIGGESMGKQHTQLRARPRLVVGTPGRINDHLERGSLKVRNTSFLVLDETDRMLDMGFSVQIDRIVKHMEGERQTLMFSATLPQKILTLSRKYLNNPERVSVGSTVAPAKNIKQSVIHIADNQKYDTLVEQLHERKGSVVVFVKTKHKADRLAKKLNKADWASDAIHGDLKQSKRERVIRAFRGKKFRILVATDVIARGLDVPHIEHVINFDLPQVPEDYIHRIGRTARAGATGEALCFVSPSDGRRWGDIQRLINPDYKSPNKKKKKSDDETTDRKRKPRRKPGKGKKMKFANKGKKSSGAGTATPGKKKTSTGKKQRWTTRRKKEVKSAKQAA